MTSTDPAADEQAGNQTGGAPTDAAADVPAAPEDQARTVADGSMRSIFGTRKRG
jgi:hypothetical protein